ncbi:MAG: NTP transferase domain-containing protein [Deltaproteobacteria bacterium]|nr:NTP transferase domain-containing protein [Deltaproteobacteria bacterium]
MSGPAATQAIVLAAGEGRRLRPLTLTTPKPLVPFFGRPLLDWAIDAVVRAGARRIAVNAWHLADAVAAHVATLARARPELELFVAREPSLLGTGGAVRNLAGWLRPEPFWVMNSDAVIAEPVASLTRAPSLLVTRAPRYRRERRLVADPDGRWRALVEGGHDDALTFCGLTLADPELPSRLPDGASCILRQGYLPFLDRLDVRLVETRTFFADTGTPRALVEAHVDGLEWVAARPGPPLVGAATS